MERPDHATAKIPPILLWTHAATGARRRARLSLFDHLVNFWGGALGGGDMPKTEAAHSRLPPPLSSWGTPVGNVSLCAPLRLFRLEFALKDSHD